jgi:hypothetical protein
MILDFTITTCLRPDILRRTLESFRANLLGVEWEKCTCYINVDPAGPMPENGIADPAHIAAHFFDHIVPNWPVVPSFPAAVAWCFSQPTAHLCFHLEDDFELLEPIDIEQVKQVMDTEGSAVVNLRLHPFAAGVRRCFLSPGLWRSDMMRDFAAQMNVDENPEIQLWRYTDAMKCGRYWPDRIVLRDIGREWLAQSGYKKNVEVAKGINPWTKWEAR